MHIREIDLNLLRLFQVMMEELNVTRAAGKVSLSQSAFSHGLARLRKTFDDQLFTRTPTGMVPTKRAEDLYLGIKRALGEIERTIAQAANFDPTRYKGLMRISVDDYLGQTIGVRVADALHQASPGLKLELCGLGEMVPLDAFRKGELQFAIRVDVNDASGVYQKRLIREEFVCLVSNDHPKIKKTLTLKQFVEHKHLLVAPFGGFTGTVDTALAKLGLKREVQMSVAHFSMAPWLLLNSDWILTLPKSIAERFATYLPIRQLEPPLELPGFNVNLLWHERDHDEALSKWARDLISRTASAGQ